MTRELLFSITRKDFDITYFCAGGKGGQKQNKTETGVRFIHEPSGARGESREERSQLQNERIAFRRMAESPQMRLWLAEEHQKWERQEPKLPESWDTDLLIEVKNDKGEWVPA